MDKKRNPRKISQLGELEADVMSLVWEKGRATVQEVKDALEPSRLLA